MKEPCVYCGGLNTYKNGHNILKNGTTNQKFWTVIQKWYCRDCEKSFQDDSCK